MYTPYKIAVVLLLIVFIFSCKKETIEEPIEILKIPMGFPLIEYPEGNEFTEARWALGKRLFYDPILSADSSISCGTCHQQKHAFTDNRMVSKGIENRFGTRNTPILSNLAYHPYFTRDGGVITLETQILVPIQEHTEFDFNIVLISDKLKQIPSYVAQSEKAYNRSPDPYVITRAIANFERTLLSGNSNYDKYFYQNDLDALSAAEQHGMDLFFSERLACGQCHNGFDLTDYSFKNNGLYEVYEDKGRYRVTQEEADKALFKVPSLRNIALTAPYMHNGSFANLSEVIDHYQTGGKAHFNKSPLLQPFDLTPLEKDHLIAFLHSLTDVDYIENPHFKAP